MGKSSIHIVPVKGGSEQHNERQKSLSYVRSDLSHLNSSFKLMGIADAQRFAQLNCKQKTGRAMQAKATPIREGVLLIEARHEVQDLKRLALKLEQRFGVKTIQAYCHKDEGHYDKITKEWKPNYHAHMVFDWTDHQSGKSIKLNRQDMSEFQTMVAQELGLERGVSSSVKHLNAIQYKSQQEEQDLARVLGVKEALPAALTILQGKEVAQQDLNRIEIQKLEKEKQSENLDKEMKDLQEAKKALEFENDLLQSNLEYVKGQTQQLQEELKQLKELKQQQEKSLHRGRAFS